jgi:hypothetical protein
LAGMGIVAHPVRKLLRTATAIISLRIAVTSFREANSSGSALGGHARLRPWPERLGLRTGWDRAPRSHRALGPHAPRRCLSRRRRSSRLVPNSSSLLTQRPRRRSVGSANTLGTGTADETLRMATGMLHASQARVPSSSGVESPSVPNRLCSGQTSSHPLMRRDCPRFRWGARRTPSSTTTLRLSASRFPVLRTPPAVHRLRPWMASEPSTRPACPSEENGLRADSEPAGGGRSWRRTSTGREPSRKRRRRTA